MDDAILGYLWDLNPELIYVREFCGTSGTGEETNEAMNTSDQVGLVRVFYHGVRELNLF